MYFVAYFGAFPLEGALRGDFQMSIWRSYRRFWKQKNSQVRGFRRLEYFLKYYSLANQAREGEGVYRGL